MKVIKHEKLPKPTETFQTTRPFNVWLTGKIELQIEAGDRLDKVSKAIRKHLTLTSEQARRLAGYYFGLGERIDRRQFGPWTTSEYRCRPGRRYLS